MVRRGGTNPNPVCAPRNPFSGPFVIHFSSIYFEVVSLPGATGSGAAEQKCGDCNWIWSKLRMAKEMDDGIRFYMALVVSREKENLQDNRGE